MNGIVLDNVPFQIDSEPLLKRLHIEVGSDDAGQILDLAQEAEDIGKPKVLYKTAYIESRGDDFVLIDGVTFKSRVLQVNLADTYRVFPFVATCGSELDLWADSINDMLGRFAADVINQMALNQAVKFFGSHLATEFGLETMATMNPGSLEDWPISEQTALFSLFGGSPLPIGVSLSDSYLMTPIKSVSGIRFATEAKFENCQLCSRESCPGRRAPYDDSLYERKYSR